VMLSLVFAASIASLWLFSLTVRKAWQVTQINAKHPNYIKLGEFVQERLSADAVLLCDEQDKLERNTLMFRADHTCYPLNPQDPASWTQVARDVADAGGIPYIVSHRSLPMKRLFVDSEDQRALYEFDR
jgi:hypothetical protein